PTRLRRALRLRLREGARLRGGRLPRRRRAPVPRPGPRRHLRSGRLPARERVTILQPLQGVSRLARIGPAEVRERYGVEPAQVPDFIALRGDPSDRIPGARGVGPRTAAAVLAQYGSLERALRAGRFAAEAEALRLYRRIAQLDAKAPLPTLAPRPPDWAQAAEA